MPERYQPLGQCPWEQAPPVGLLQHNIAQALSHGPSCVARRRVWRTCLRKGCGRLFHPRRWNQRYCQDAHCTRLVRRWQAAKRQQRRRQNPAQRQQHCQAERQRRQRCREARQAREPTVPEVAPTRGSDQASPPLPEHGAWSRSNPRDAIFCDRPGCHDPVRAPCRCPARYCGDECAQAMQRVLDRERKWLRRNSSVGRFKRQLEYQAARRQRAAPRRPPEPLSP